jgi:hypothetical protein
MGKTLVGCPALSGPMQKNKPLAAPVRRGVVDLPNTGLAYRLKA